MSSLEAPPMRIVELRLIAYATPEQVPDQGQEHVLRLPEEAARRMARAAYHDPSGALAVHVDSEWLAS